VDYCVKKDGKVIVIYNGETTDERKKAMAESAATGGSYGDGCTVHPYTPAEDDTTAAG
jgi:hypothetical protein